MLRFHFCHSIKSSLKTYNLKQLHHCSHYIFMVADSRSFKGLLLKRWQNVSPWSVYLPGYIKPNDTAFYLIHIWRWGALFALSWEAKENPQNKTFQFFSTIIRNVLLSSGSNLEAPSSPTSPLLRFVSLRRSAKIKFVSSKTSWCYLRSFWSWQESFVVITCGCCSARL